VKRFGILLFSEILFTHDCSEMFCELFVFRKSAPDGFCHLLAVDVAELISVIDCLDEKFIH